jgi:ketosteroid isomerase-like protein
MESGCAWPASQLPFSTERWQLRSKVIGNNWRLFFILIAILLRPGASAQSAGQSNPEQGRILSLENAWNQALQQKDAAALRMLLAPDLVYVDYDGTLMDKTEYLASVQAASLHPVHLVSESMKVHLYGGVAMVEGVCREIGIKNGRPYSVRLRFTDAWIRRGESWICVASQSTLIEP